MGSRVKVFGHSWEAAGVTAKARNSYGSGSGSLTVRLGGYTVYSRSLAYTYTHSGSRSHTFGKVRQTWFVGPVPVTVQVKVGVSYSWSIKLALTPVGAGLNGYAGGAPWASVYGGVGVPGYSVGLTFKASFVNPKIRFAANVNFCYVTGYVRLEITAVKFKIKFVVSCWPFSWSKTVFEKRYGEYTYYLLRV